MHTTNPKFVAKRKDTRPLYPELSGIEYPSEGDIKMKPKPTDQIPSTNRPRIDRGSKPSFGQKNFQQPINKVSAALQQEKLYDEVLEKEKEALHLGKEYINTLNVPISPSGTDQAELFNKQTELEYKLIQKEHELNDTLTVVEPELEPLEAIPSDEQTPELFEISARIDAKREEHAKYKKMREQIDRKREELAPANREQHKRLLQVSYGFSKHSVHVSPMVFPLISR